MPADPSSSIPAALTQLAHADPFGPAEGPHLLAYLATIGDPRRPSGRRHPLAAILAMAAAAVLAGARSVTAIAEWAADSPQPVRAALGARRDAPDRWVVPAEATIRRTLARMDPDLLAAVTGAWLADRDRPGQRRRAVAVDGKTLRGARRDGRQVHLLAAMDHATRAVLAQRQVNGASGEVPGFQPLLGDLDLTGTVVTADALHTHGDAAEFLVTRKHTHYLFTVKANQCAARRLAVSPNGVGRDSKRYLWVRWLTWIRKEKGTRACQRTGGQAQASGMTRRVTRVIWRKLG